jgi:hypothetical protein
MQSRTIDFTNKRKTILTDLLVTGTSYYRTLPTMSKSGVEFEVLNPLNTFVDRDPSSQYLKNSRRSVVRNYMTVDQILAKYGTLLSAKDLETLGDLEDYNPDGASTTYVRSFESVHGQPMSDGILGGFEVTPMIPFERSASMHYKYYPVYDVEWIKTEKVKGDFIEYRYEGTRIGSKIYIPTGKVENVVRPMDNPNKCFTTVNGMFYSDRNGDPYSLVIITAPLQDKFDILHFYRDNLIAESGTQGDWIDVAYVPKIFGHDLAERLLKWKAYKKQGMALIDSSQEGDAPMNTTYSGFDDTVKYQAIQGIEMAIQSVENTCSSITGVFREKLGGIEQRDAVTNVEVGVRQSTYITKQFFHMMDLLTREILIDILDVAKVVFKKGVTGTLVLGEKLNKIFTALPEHYSFTEHDIHITDSSELMKEQELIKQLTFEFAKNNNIDPEIVIEAISARGLTNLKQSVLAALNKKKQESNQLGQLSQQVEELSKQLKQASTDNQKLQQKINTLNEEKLKIEKDKLTFEKDLGWFEAKSADEYNEKKIQLDEKRIKLEALQLIDNNPNNNEIKND